MSACDVRRSQRCAGRSSPQLRRLDSLLTVAPPCADPHDYRPCSEQAQRRGFRERNRTCAGGCRDGEHMYGDERGDREALPRHVDSSLVPRCARCQRDIRVHRRKWAYFRWRHHPATATTPAPTPRRVSVVGSGTIARPAWAEEAMTKTCTATSPA